MRRTIILMGLDGVEHHAAQAAGVTAVERHRVDVVADRYTTLDDENHRGRVHSRNDGANVDEYRDGGVVSSKTGTESIGLRAKTRRAI